MMDTVERPIGLDLGTVGMVMTRRVVKLAKSTRLGDAARILEAERVGAAPVVEGDQVIGMIGVRDLVQRARAVSEHVQQSGPFLRYDRVLDRQDEAVEATMAPQVVTVQEEWPVLRAVASMDAAGVNRVPVLNADGRLVGIVARDDVIRVLASWVRERGLDRPRIAPD